MSLPTGLGDIVLPRHDEQMQVLSALVSGAIAFPSDSKNTLLLHGTYGSGKTTLGRMLPILLELNKATDAQRSSYNYCYKTGRNQVSVTPAQQHLPVLVADVEFIACVGQLSAQRHKVVESIQRQMLMSGGHFETHYQFYIFDEVDEWGDNQSDLKSLVTSAGARAVFILTTNHLNKLDKGLRSRAMEIEMNMADAQQTLHRLRRLYPHCAQVSDQTLLQVIAKSAGDWRELDTLMSVVQLKLQSA